MAGIRSYDFKYISVNSDTPVWCGCCATDDAEAAGLMCEGEWKVMRQESPCRRVHLNPFFVQRRMVSKREFLDFIFSSLYAERLKCFPEDGPYWDSIATMPGYDDSFPAVGMALEEADAYAFHQGGRLLTEEEHEFLVRGGESNGFVSRPAELPLPNSAFQDPGVYVRELSPVHYYPVPTKFEVADLVGQARELVVGQSLLEWVNFEGTTAQPLSVYDPLPVMVMKGLSKFDSVWHAGRRFVRSSRCRGEDRARLLSMCPAGFRCAFDFQPSRFG